ncbi:hypothetical protein KFK09_015773 [Dendrobium nobile]|uniref:Uncharacterized protein n=1 Tax=Dendrobium nobile TaxID=94219 RepID=A0A8T3B5R2_DENNO|nr:hypothetical protein KFK09_015773 [Dendrobium nobile]
MSGLMRNTTADRSLELSEPTSPEVQVIIHSVAHYLFATLSPKIPSQPWPQWDLSQVAPFVSGRLIAELVENTSINLHRFIAVLPDYLEHILFGAQHGRKLMQILAIAGDSDIFFTLMMIISTAICLYFISGTVHLRTISPAETFLITKLCLRLRSCLFIAIRVNPQLLFSTRLLNPFLFFRVLS